RLEGWFGTRSSYPSLLPHQVHQVLSGILLQDDTIHRLIAPHCPKPLHAGPPRELLPYLILEYVSRLAARRIAQAPWLAYCVLLCVGFLSRSIRYCPYPFFRRGRARCSS